MADDENAAHHNVASCNERTAWKRREFGGREKIGGDEVLRKKESVTAFPARESF